MYMENKSTELVNLKFSNNKFHKPFRVYRVVLCVQIYGMDGWMDGWMDECRRDERRWQACRITLELNNKTGVRRMQSTLHSKLRPSTTKTKITIIIMDASDKDSFVSVKPQTHLCQALGHCTRNNGTRSIAG